MAEAIDHATYPTRVRGMLADTEPRPPLSPGGVHPYTDDGCAACGMPSQAGCEHDCPADAEGYRYRGARTILCMEVKDIATAYLDAADQLARVRRILAVEQGDEGAAGDGWRITSTGEGWRSRSDAYVYRIARGRWVVARVHGGAVCADLMTYPNALEAMEAAAAQEPTP